MAIAPSKLGQFVAERIWEGNDALVRSLRAAGLVKPKISDGELISVFRKVREEHEALSEEVPAYNSPNERICVFLEPYLSSKGRKWAVSLESLDLPDDETQEPRGDRRPWWEFWG